MAAEIDRAGYDLPKRGDGQAQAFAIVRRAGRMRRPRAALLAKRKIAAQHLHASRLKRAGGRQQNWRVAVRAGAMGKDEPLL